MKIAFLGLGHMGSEMARNLARSGQTLTVWNRSPARAEPLREAGATLAANPREAARGCEIVFTMLADDAALEEVLEGPNGLLAGLPAGALHVSMSTISVACASRTVERHAARSQRFLSAPVFGRPEAAAAAKLFIVAGGVTADLERARPLFASIGQRVFHVSEEASAANLVKLCGNFLILAAIEAMAEAMALAQKGGVEKRQLVEVLTGSLFDSIVYRGYGAALSEERFRPAGFAAPLGLKDMRLVGQAAETLRVPMPVLNVLRDHLLQTIGSEGEDIDWSGIGRIIAHNAGLDGTPAPGRRS